MVLHLLLPGNSFGKMKNSSNSFCSSRSVLTAVAFQDHLVKSLSLQDPIKKNSQPSGRNTRKKTSTSRKTEAYSKRLECDKEYVLDAKAKPLTLAQKLGLVDAPPARLTDKEWRAVKSKSNDRKDSDQPCVICKEEFGTEDQVLLSCSHVFHKTCLQAFERFSGGKTCPMCRKEEYETRVIHEGRKLWQHKCAIKIQAAWRGYVIRSWYRKLRQTVPPNDPMLRKKFYEEKLHYITDRLVQSIENIEVESFLSEIDRSVEESRRVMRFVGEGCFKTMSETDWERVHEQAQDRFSSECPICFANLCSIEKHSSLDVEHNSVEAKNQKVRPVVLLSCSHVFHKKCLEAFEELSLNSSNICPVCRSPYYKKYF